MRDKNQMPADKTTAGKKWNMLSEEMRLKIIRTQEPNGSWDFYAQSTWGNLFGGVQDRLEKLLN